MKMNIATILVGLLVGEIALSIIGRMVFDGLFTARAHDLAGLEIVVYSLLSFPTALVGAYVGQLMERRQTT